MALILRYPHASTLVFDENFKLTTMFLYHLKRHVDLDTFSAWVNSVCEWMDDNINRYLGGGDYEEITRLNKQPQLFVYGPPNSGKTLLFQTLLQIEFATELGVVFQFCDDGGRFALEGLRKSTGLIYADEFTVKELNPKTLNKLLAGETVKIDEKCKRQTCLTYKGPIILCGNTTVFQDDDVQRSAFNARVTAVHTDIPL